MIAVRRHGRTAKTDTLLCIHGGPGMDSSYMSGFTSDALGLRCVIYDQSPLPGEPIPEDLNAEQSVIELLERAHKLKGKGESMSLFAHSWGTYIALEASIREPKLFRTLVLCNPYPLTWERALEAGGRLVERVSPDHLARVDQLESEGTESAGKELMSLVSYAYTSPRMASVDIGVGRYNPTINARVLESVAGFDQRDAVAAIAPRTVCIYGADDYLVPADTFELLKAGARQFVIPDCGHFPFAEAPDDLASLLREIL